MSKILRVAQKIFGSSAGADQRAVFGSLSAGAPAFSTDPATIQSLANYLTGWFGAVIDGNSPAIEDMNALQFLKSYQLAYLFQAGVAEWNAETTYYIGSIVNDSGTLYRSLTDDNLNHAVSNTAYWKGFSTDAPGTMKDYLGSTAPAGYVLASGRTIGNTSSGGTERANADTVDLFTLLWNDYSNVILVIQASDGTPTTRGASAAADYAANKRMPLPDLRGRVTAGNDGMGGTPANRLTTSVSPYGDVPGSVGGEQTHALADTEMPVHTHTQDPHTHDLGPGDTGTGNFASSTIVANFVNGTRRTTTVTATNQIAGGGLAHNNVQPTYIVNKIIKL